MATESGEVQLRSKFRHKSRFCDVPYYPQGGAGSSWKHLKVNELEQDVCWELHIKQDSALNMTTFWF